MPKVQPQNDKLGLVNVYPQKDGSNEIEVSFMPDPQMLVGEGKSQAVLALDASVSFMGQYGVGGGPFASIKKPNFVGLTAKEIGKLLCNCVRSSTAHGMYWAVAPAGDKVEEFGEHSEQGWDQQKIAGPQREKWGRGTCLLPILQKIAGMSKSADWTMGVIITDGKIDDEPACMEYCKTLCKDLVERKEADPDHRDSLKLVLIGVGSDVDKEQLERFDDMGDTFELNYDLWSSHPNVLSMEDPSELIEVLFGELVSEDMIIASAGVVTDRKGKVLLEKRDGLNAKFKFILPKGEKAFIIKVTTDEGEEIIEQDCSSVI